MGNSKRTYKIEMLMTGNPPKPEPVLKHGKVVIGPNDPIVFNKNTDGMKKIEPYELTFELDNPNKTDLRFIRNMSDVMWCHGDVSACPTSFCELPGVIWVDAIDPDGEWIKVINMDLVPQPFRFTLNFADKNITNPVPADYVPLDPIGGNENRGSAGTRFEINAYAAVGIGLVAGLVAFTAAAMFQQVW